MDVKSKVRRLNELIAKGIGNLREKELEEARGINIELARLMEEFIYESRK